MRQRFMLPARLLTKYSAELSGAQLGLQSTCASSVMCHGVPPAAGTTKMSRALDTAPPGRRLMPQNAMNRPLGDHAGLSESCDVRSLTSPLSRRTVRSTDVAPRLVGTLLRPVE